MNIRDEIAAELDGSEYPLRISRELAERAKLDGVVIVYGASDDLMEFEGAINNEVGAYDDHSAFLTKDGLLENECANDDCPHFAKLKKSVATIEAIWGDGEYSWTYKTTIPHATFELVEDGEKYCRGIVFNLADVRS